ncbi:LAS seventeen-binding protein 3 [Lasiodiplodia hormozganensis]|uniref:LAS seventeen-binding protein 3 n=1 Tax=Lasiodiplodia hormozganensis TaxID=869390 RepID=A0AA39Z616_9PEZI|nr:LAS seventeen-binding protein 3 [Lasiodiplodia hormozganensis]
MWQRTKQQGKVGFDKVWGWADKLGDPVNKLSNKLGSEAFWPMSIDKESDKAARILSSFCKEGFEKEASSSTLSLPAASTAPPPSPSPSSSSSGKLPDDASRPKGKQYVLNKIPPDVIRNAVGLAIFTTMRTGFYISGASGSGVLIARQADGSWSPPSGILLHTAGVGFLVGIDIYDCVLVINTAEALDAFCKVRCTVGGEISAAVGPVGAGGIVDSEVHKRRAPIFTYVKSRGFYAGVQMDGTVVIERSDENERFYGERVPVARILRGDVGNVPEEAVAPLWEAVKAAEGAAAKLFPMTPEGRPVSGYVPRHRTMPSIN